MQMFMFLHVCVNNYISSSVNNKILLSITRNFPGKRKFSEYTWEIGKTHARSYTKFYYEILATVLDFEVELLTLEN